MVKFSKELEAQLIPEWKDAFVNYWQLKKHVKKVKLSRKSKQLEDINNYYDIGRSIFDPIRRVFHRISSGLHTHSSNPETFQMRRKMGDGEESANEGGEDEEEGEQEEEEIHQNVELLQLFSEEDEVQRFFDRLNEELDKVNKFYAAKEAEFLERGEILNKQLQILVDLKQVLYDRGLRTKSMSSSTTSRMSRSCSLSPARTSDFSETQSEYSESISSETSQTEEVIAALEKNGINFVPGTTPGRGKKTKKGIKPKMGVRIDIPATTPTRTISAITSMLWEDLVNNPKKEGTGEFINRKKIQCAEKMIRGAFVELYRGLGLLKRYSSLNMMAFVKILKKFDKVSNQKTSANYLRTVKESHFISSDKVVRLMDEVESLFTQHFAKGDRKKAMKFLRPQPNKESHMVTFFVGLFTGCFATLFIVYAILAHMSGMFSPRSERGYMEAVYPVFSMFALLSLHLFMYGCNLLFWKSTRINYLFIFEFQHHTALKYRDAFLIGTSLLTAVVTAMVIHLILLARGVSQPRVDAIQGVLLLIFVAILICPLNIFYRPTRYYFIKVMRNIICSPFYKVLMVDFFMADQLTSQIPLLRHIESTVCYFVAENFKTHHYETCKSGKIYRELAYVISFAPYYWRAMQCARRWLDECDVNHLVNLGKYVSAMVAAGARITYARQPTVFWMVIVLVTSLVATVYQLYWDFVKDWGLLNFRSRNPWLRDDLVLKHKSIYYISIAFNFMLRLAWLETVMHFNNIGLFESRMLDFFLASLEVIRRGHWNYYRLENEHLNNVGKFRAVKTVPLPFRETDSD
ncbi:OLC1v1019657C1 [Oldenlandia corymbosa var. corymbosa]|uniref:OLC1v1019657C1 n=1 Tax=Oldenlandia corymbosa var. corymbosa TaxID=529605 RepID=A0AAV1EEX9_OLDCO|nr:OLC1v1019657C1 [Oldenlandia corymbosa var. corymbosa]